MTDTWAGRFPPNEIISLLNVNRRYNLAESTSQNLSFEELLDFVGPNAVRNICLGYGDSQGLEFLRQIVGQMMNIPAEHVISTQGTALGLYLLAVELCRPGDDVVIFTPCFPPSRDSLVGSGVNLRQVPLEFDDGYQIDLEYFAACLTENTRLVSIATPQNPSGVTVSQETIEAMLELMLRVSPYAYLFIDETYREATYGEAKVPASFAGLHPRIITAASVSKAYGAPGLRVGWLTVEDEELRQRLITAKMNIVISGSPLNENLAALLLEQRAQILTSRKTLLKQGLSIVAEWTRIHEEYLDWVRPDGGALCCMRLKESQFDSESLTRFWKGLADRELQLADGHWFGECGRVFRLGFGYLSLNTLAEALDLLGDALKDFSAAKEPL
ncbi:pyridoxal phosphate-dependent aminotransferase [Spartinivicinus ruber]|uniref:pyridoxal phosphate-dependent aminotransferase n=1 Tax=Spartinivicinus ruber TaxID=2683272 RepID=UPI0013D8C86A|nr:pyridoxal phosphate-dependent aminotransferase [Spartinivicinus ruber]